MISSAGCDQISIILHRAWLLLPRQPSVHTAFNLLAIFSFTVRIQNSAQSQRFSSPRPSHRKCITLSISGFGPRLLFTFVVVQRGTSSVNQEVFSKKGPCARARDVFLNNICRVGSRQESAAERLLAPQVAARQHANTGF